MSWCDLDLTCELTEMTLNHKILSRLYLETVRCRKFLLCRDIGYGMYVCKVMV